LTVQSGRYSYQSVAAALSHIRSTEGIRGECQSMPHCDDSGLYVGTLATILRDAPFSGLYYSLYVMLKGHIQSPNSDAVQRGLERMTVGVVAGVLATTLTHPQVRVSTCYSLTSGCGPNAHAAFHDYIDKRTSGSVSCLLMSRLFVLDAHRNTVSEGSSLV
jgi:hypothetical protein